LNNTNAGIYYHAAVTNPNDYVLLNNAVWEIAKLQC